MHKSRLGEITIDCNTDDLEGAVKFWSAALGVKAKAYEDETFSAYHLEAAANELDINIQAVKHPSRVHIDIETDDIEAEVQRLEKLGATRVGEELRWWVMQAPSGHRFCVARVCRSNFETEANEWP